MLILCRFNEELELSTRHFIHFLPDIFNASCGAMVLNVEHIPESPERLVRLQIAKLHPLSLIQ